MDEFEYSYSLGGQFLNIRTVLGYPFDAAQDKVFEDWGGDANGMCDGIHRENG